MKTLIILYALVLLTLVGVGVYIESIIQDNTQPAPASAGVVTTLRLVNYRGDYARALQPAIMGDNIQKGVNPWTDE